MKKLTVAKARKIDEEVLRLKEEYKNIYNPYKDKVDRALKLKIFDFSVEDKLKADRILTERKLKTQLKHAMKRNHPHIDML